MDRTDAPITENIEKSDAWLDAWLEKPSSLPPSSIEFRRKVMANIHAVKLPWYVRLQRFFFRPRRTQWSIASGMVTASLAIVFGIGLNQYWGDTQVPNMATMTTPQKVMVSFRVQLDGAHEVSLAGGFNQWQPVRMIKSDDHKVWSIEVTITPGQHEYMFVVDGEKWISDPLSKLYQDDGFGGKNSVIVVNQDRQHAI